MPAIINEEGNLEFRMGGYVLASWSNPNFSKEHLSLVSGFMTDIYQIGRQKGIEEHKLQVREVLGLEKDLT